MFDFPRRPALSRERDRAPRLWRPVGTQALIALNLGVFFLQWLWDAMTPPMLATMGGMVSVRISDGEWWRLFSCTVLHGGLMHVALNCYVLFVLGSFVERVIGSGRFLVLYVVSGVCASVGSFFWTTAVSVGASGAVFGLLGAQGVLAYWPRGLLPDAVLPNARRAAAINLLLNIGVSFMPNVDAAAHFTGAIVGAALVFTGVLTPKATTPLPLQLQRLRSWLRFGIATTAAYAAVALFGVTHGRPWLYSAEIAFEDRVLPGNEQTHQFPTFLPPAKRVASGKENGVDFGADLFQPYWLVVRFLPAGAFDASSDAFHKKVRGELKARAGASREPKTTFIRGRPVTCGGSREGGLLVDTCILLDSSRIVRLEGIYWSGPTAKRYRSLTAEIASRWWTRAAQD